MSYEVAIERGDKVSINIDSSRLNEYEKELLITLVKNSETTEMVTVKSIAGGTAKNDSKFQIGNISFYKYIDLFDKNGRVNGCECYGVIDPYTNIVLKNTETNKLEPLYFVKKINKNNVLESNINTYMENIKYYLVDNIGYNMQPHTVDCNSLTDDGGYGSAERNCFILSYDNFKRVNSVYNSLFKDVKTCIPLSTPLAHEGTVIVSNPTLSLAKGSNILAVGANSEVLSVDVTKPQNYEFNKIFFKVILNPEVLVAKTIE